MLQFSFSTNGFVTKPEWECEERPMTTCIENGMVCRLVDFRTSVPIQSLVKKIAKVLNLKDNAVKCNLWVRIKHDNHFYVAIFQDYYKRDNGTYQIPAQTDCVAATTATVWETVTWNALMSDMNLLSPSVNHIEYWANIWKFVLML